MAGRAVCPSAAAGASGGGDLSLAESALGGEDARPSILGGLDVPLAPAPASTVAFAFAFASSLFYGTADFLGGIAARRARVLAVTLWSQAAGLAALAAVSLVVGGAPTAVAWPWAVGAGLFGSSGVLLFYRALAGGHSEHRRARHLGGGVVRAGRGGPGVGRAAGCACPRRNPAAAPAIMLVGGGDGKRNPPMQVERCSWRS
jgi:hypothetical protein